MAEENQVMTNDPKKVEAGKRLTEHNCRKREELKVQKSKVEPMLISSTCYSIGAVLAVGVICGLGYYRKFLLYYKMDKKSIVNDLYHASLISVFAVGYLMLGKKILKVAPPSIQKFDLEDTGKLVAIVAAPEMTREYLIKQKILPEHINV